MKKMFWHHMMATSGVQKKLWWRNSEQGRDNWGRVSVWTLPRQFLDQSCLQGMTNVWTSKRKRQTSLRKHFTKRVYMQNMRFLVIALIIFIGKIIPNKWFHFLRICKGQSRVRICLGDTWPQGIRGCFLGSIPEFIFWD